MDKFSFSIPNKKEYVTCARMMISSIASVKGFDIEKIEDIKLAIGEACNNVIIHSNSDEDIFVEVNSDDDSLNIVIKDTGIGFDADNVKVPNCDDYEGSGLGLFIIKSLMDKVEIKSSKDETKIKMIKRL